MRKIATQSIALILLFPSMLLADGGTLRLSARNGDFQVSVFTSPAVLRCGIIDISVLVQDAITGKVRTDLPVKVQLKQAEAGNGNRTAEVLEQTATTATATNKLFRAAQFEVPQPGIWRGSVSLIADPLSARSTTEAQATNAKPLAFDLAISPPSPAWLDLAPWIGWPFGMVALFFVHQRLASGARR
jgi:hypothetical protein